MTTGGQRGSAHSILVLVIVLAIISTLGWVFVSNLMSKNAARDSVQHTSTAQEVASVSASKEDLASSPSELLTNALQSAGIPNNEFSAEAMILRRSMPEYGFSAPSTATSTVTTMVRLPESEYGARTTSLKKYFTDRDYAVVDNGKSGAGKSINYDGGKFSCEYNDWGMSNEARGTFRTLLISCASFEDFEKNAKDLKTFFDLLASDTSIDKTAVKMIPLNIKPSNTSGYNIFKGAAVMSPAKLDTPYVWFYQTPDSKWHFVYAAVGGFRCADVSSLDAAKAFAGHKCFETDGRQYRTL